MNVVTVSLSVLCAGLIAWRVADAARARRRRPEPSSTRILFPFIGRALSQPVLDATLRLARAEDATLVPAYLARVPLHLPLVAPLPVECAEAMPLLEAIERRARHEGVAVDARIERGRTYRHALGELLSHERPERIVVAADTTGTDGFDAADVAWLLDHAEGELIVLRPAHDRLMRVRAEDPAPAAASATPVGSATASGDDDRDPGRRRRNPVGHGERQGV